MTAAEMLELAERLEKEADSYYLQQGNNTVDDLRAAARVVRAMRKVEMASNERDAWKWNFEPGFGVMRNSSSGHDTALGAIEATPC